MTFKTPKSLKFREKLRKMVRRWRRVWKKHHSHKRHKGARRKP